MKKNNITILEGIKLFTIKCYEFFMNPDSKKIKNIRIKTKNKIMKG